MDSDRATETRLFLSLIPSRSTPAPRIPEPPFRSSKADLRRHPEHLRSPSFPPLFFSVLQLWNGYHRGNGARGGGEGVETEVPRLTGVGSVVACRTRCCNGSATIEIHSRRCFDTPYGPNDSISSRLTTHRFAESTRPDPEGNRKSGPGALVRLTNSIAWDSIRCYASL